MRWFSCKGFISEDIGKSREIVFFNYLKLAFCDSLKKYLLYFQYALKHGFKYRDGCLYSYLKFLLMQILLTNSTF